MQLQTGLLYSSRYTQHLTGDAHPEKPERVSYVYSQLAKGSALKDMILLEPHPAALEWMEEIHSPEYIRRVQQTCEAGFPVIDSPDTGVSRDSFEVARLAAGGALDLVSAVMEGKIANGFALVRPPGHHAERKIALGFCLFNSVAVAARYLEKRYGLRRVLIVDWDVHHGNGTQNAFYEDPTVFYFSVHQYPFYPGTGAREETGSGAGRGTTLNIPLPAGSGDDIYLESMEQIFYPRALNFRPDFVLVSAGFDAHRDDPLAQMEVTSEGYGVMTEMVKAVARECADGRIVSLLEGGYHLPALAECVETHLRSLRDPEVHFQMGRPGRVDRTGKFKRPPAARSSRPGRVDRSKS